MNVGRGSLLLCLAVVMACPMLGCQSATTREKTTLGGAGAGGLIGGIIGHQSGKTAQGALIGAAVGAIGGYVLGTELEKNETAPDVDGEARAAQLFHQANRTDDMRTAISLYSEAIRLDPTHPEFFNNRGLAHLRLGDRERARTDFEQALSLDSSYRPARDNLQRLRGT